MSDQKLQSTGEKRMRTQFNPSSSSTVDVFKASTAILIDICEDQKPGADPEKLRLLALAQTCYEQAAMWAVKAVTG